MTNEEIEKLVACKNGLGDKDCSQCEKAFVNPEDHEICAEILKERLEEQQERGKAMRLKIQIFIGKMKTATAKLKLAPRGRKVKGKPRLKRKKGKRSS
jgi:predicted nucleic acid-binding Zn ribbon protein